MTVKEMGPAVATRRAFSKVGNSGHRPGIGGLNPEKVQNAGGDGVRTRGRSSAERTRSLSCRSGANQSCPTPAVAPVFGSAPGQNIDMIVRNTGFDRAPCHRPTPGGGAARGPRR